MIGRDTASRFSNDVAASDGVGARPVPAAYASR
jgi:hypothetical protein